MSPKQSLIGSFFGGPRVPESPQSRGKNWNKDIQEEGLDDPFFEEEEGMELYDTFEDNKQAKEEEFDVRINRGCSGGTPGKSLKVRKVIFAACMDF